MSSSVQDRTRRLQPLQNRDVRIIINRKGYVSSDEIDLEHGRWKIEELKDRNQMFMPKMRHSLSVDKLNGMKYCRYYNLHPKHVIIYTPFTLYYCKNL